METLMKKLGRPCDQGGRGPTTATLTLGTVDDIQRSPFCRPEESLMTFRGVPDDIQMSPYYRPELPLLSSGGVPIKIQIFESDQKHLLKL